METNGAGTKASVVQAVEATLVEAPAGAPVVEAQAAGARTVEAQAAGARTVEAQAAGAQAAEALIDEEEARRKAYEEMEAEIKAVPANEIAARRVDMHLASAMVQSVAKRDAEPERRAEFERLSVAKLYDMGLLARLIKLALAAWFVREMQLSSQYRASNATVPEAVVQQAQALRATMVRVITFWMGDVPEVATLLEFVRSGNGHKDMALDLRELARIYRRDDFRAKIMPGSPGYDPADALRATQLAEAIIACLGLAAGTEAERWSALADRVWTLMVRAYDQHRSRGIMLFGSREDVSITYPSLVTALRSAPTRRRRPEAPTPQNPGGEPAGEPGNEPEGDDSANG